MKSENEKRQIWLQRFNQHACSILQDGNLRMFFRQIHERPASGGDSWNKYESCASNKYESCFSRNPEKVERLHQEKRSGCLVANGGIWLDRGEMGINL